MCIFTANKMCATLEKFLKWVYYYRSYHSKMCAGIDFTRGDTGILSKKVFKFNKTLLGVLILAAALVLAGCGGAKSTRAKADETVHTALFDFTCGQAEVIDSYKSISIPDGDKLVQFQISVTNTSEDTYPIYKDDFQLQWDDGDDDFCVGCEPEDDVMLPDVTNLAPGESVSGLIVAKIPTDASTLTVAYQENYEDGSNANAYFVDLSL